MSYCFAAHTLCICAAALWCMARTHTELYDCLCECIFIILIRGTIWNNHYTSNANAHIVVIVLYLPYGCLILHTATAPYNLTNLIVCFSTTKQQHKKKNIECTYKCSCTLAKAIGTNCAPICSLVSLLFPVHFTPNRGNWLASVRTLLSNVQLLSILCWKMIIATKISRHLDVKCSVLQMQHQYTQKASICLQAFFPTTQSSKDSTFGAHYLSECT